MSTTKLAIGDNVMIYQDPITCQQPEGEATLMRQISVERWEVHFDGDDDDATYTRWILASGVRDAAE